MPKIIYKHDQETKVWIATSPDVKGLVLEDEDLLRLKQRAEAAAAELEELNT